ncbi:uncharacterized protein EI97DRAFT_233437 [Westerdykella ornata]|uniref:Uncharacterized protein n=1 Tax=Westerdykella ornata TaxID=318751 RepID=A0A6A6J970_WESOR|nr:uncharacterized protein EI97DRAFT_233437 [Westerdykella ornata]KAF2272186.1 hypothetical protein EI97DRAFT_233437 [Westerdykella ornata]
MDAERPHHSITLPRSFQFHYEENPKTPEPQAPEEDLQPPPPPPPPPRATLKVRRRRTTAAAPINYGLDEPIDDLPIPTIEAPELQPHVHLAPPTLNNHPGGRFLSPPVTLPRMLSPPKTPVSQVRIVGDCDDGQTWSTVNKPTAQSETSSRPASSSGFSDSSISSRGSVASFPSLGGSCTSPEDDRHSPFPLFSEVKYSRAVSSPLIPQRPSQPASIPRMKIKVRTVFTEEMDRHLWMTYMTYLQDPTVTPFKALPSTVPPNGACHRVARMARKTWKGPRTSSALALGRSTSKFASRCGTPDTIRPVKSGSSTPVPISGKTYMRFPSEKQCRKRLRYLAKHRPSLSAHYQRLVDNRSPSPFESSPRERESSPPRRLSSPFVEEAPSFSIRDMNVSLTTSTAPSMQYGNPLSQLASDATPRAPKNDWSHARASAHQKSQSLHIGLGLGIGSMLGSSFSQMSEMTDMSISQHNAQTWHAPSGHAPRLGSPLQLHAPRPISRPFRRRALHNFEEQVRNRGDSFVEQLFGAPAESSHRRVRSRGFSLGDMVEGSRRPPLSTSGPPEFNPFANLADVMPGQQHPSTESQLAEGQATIRLGSPFNAKPSNTFPRASILHGFEPPASFEQRFAGLPATPDRSDRS